MKKWKFAAWVMAVTLTLAPAAAAYADDTTTTPAPTDSTTTPAPTDSTTTPDSDSSTVCTQTPSDEDSDDADDADDTDDAEDTGDVEPGDDTDKTPDSPSTPAPQAFDRSGYQQTLAQYVAKGRGNDHKDNGKKDEHKPQTEHKGDDTASNTNSDTPSCYQHDNGKHKGWSNKIQNMLKRLDELKQAADSLQKQLDRLKEWARTNGSATDGDALKQILDALGAKDEAGEADTDDLIVLAETKDQLNDTAGSVQTLEKALTTNYTDDNVYKLLSSKLVKSGQKGIKVYVKGKKPQFDVQPIVVEGRTLV
ncbi:MAG: hypothetical protein WCC10_05680, partial [Tumebacillaceae bacterium]